VVALSAAAIVALYVGALAINAPVVLSFLPIPFAFGSVSLGSLILHGADRDLRLASRPRVTSPVP
jgi:hypothetical protein